MTILQELKRLDRTEKIKATFNGGGILEDQVVEFDYIVIMDRRLLKDTITLLEGLIDSDEDDQN